MKAIVWSNAGCSYCEQAKNLLKSKNIEVEERNIALGTWTVQQLQEAVPGARTVPQIFVDDKYVGGFSEEKSHFLLVAFLTLLRNISLLQNIGTVMKSKNCANILSKIKDIPVVISVGMLRTKE